MSCRVDLYPIALPRLASMFGSKGWEHGRAIVDALRADSKLDETMIDALLSGRLRASQPTEESGALASLICHLAHRVRDAELNVLFDVGGVWNAFEQLIPTLKGEERRMARVLLHGRPLIGAKIVSDWNSYSWIFARELETFTEVLARASKFAAHEVAELRAWLQPLRERKLDIFVAIG